MKTIERHETSAVRSVVANQSRTASILDLRRLGARIKSIAWLMECSTMTVTRTLKEAGKSDPNHRSRGTW